MLNNLLITAQATDDFYGTIHNYFKSTSFQVELLPYLLVAVSCLVVLIGCGIFYMRWSSSRRIYLPTGTLEEERHIRMVLEHCITTRARLDFQLRDDGDGRNLYASCMVIDVPRDALVLECSSVTAPPTFLYQGREIKFYFLHKGKPKAFYWFVATVIKTVIVRKGIFQLFVTIPATLNPGQKRNFLRLDPPDRLILGLYMWPLPNEKKAVMASVSFWNKPTLMYTSEESFQFKINDLSAGGVGLSIARGYSHLEELPFDRSRMFVLMLDLWEPVQQSSLKLWTICRVQSSVPTLDSGNLKLGVKFLAWGQISQTDPDTIIWHKIKGDEGIPQLGDWIIKRHLEEVREYVIGLQE